MSYARKILLATVVGLFQDVSANRDPPTAEMQKKPTSSEFKKFAQEVKEFQSKSDVLVLLLGGNPVADQYTVPVWKNYCKAMKYDFWHQPDSVEESVPFGWNMPIIVREFLSKKKSGWKFVWFWQWDSMPVVFDQGIELITKGMVIGGDREHKVALWCPSDCDDVYSDSLAGCHGPMISGCVARPQNKAREILAHWWGMRDRFEREVSPVRTGLKKTQLMNYHNDIRFWDAQEKFGKFKSEVIKRFDFTKEHGNDKLAMIRALLANKKYKFLNDILSQDDLKKQGSKKKKSKITGDTGDVLGFEASELEAEEEKKPTKKQYVHLDPLEEMENFAEKHGIEVNDPDLTPEQRTLLAKHLASRIQEEL